MHQTFDHSKQGLTSFQRKYANLVTQKAQNELRGKRGNDSDLLMPSTLLSQRMNLRAALNPPLAGERPSSTVAAKNAYRNYKLLQDESIERRPLQQNNFFEENQKPPKPANLSSHVIEGQIKHMKLSQEQRQEVFEEEMIKRLKDVQSYTKKVASSLKKLGAKVDLVTEDLRDVQNENMRLSMQEMVEAVDQQFAEEKGEREQEIEETVIKLMEVINQNKEELVQYVEELTQEQAEKQQ